VDQTRPQAPKGNFKLGHAPPAPSLAKLKWDHRRPQAPIRSFQVGPRAPRRHQEFQVDTRPQGAIRIFKWDHAPPGA